MRRSGALALGVVALLAPRAAAAQQREFGVKAGPNFSVVSADSGPADVYTRRVAIAGGGFVVLPLGRRTALQVELLQMPKGTKLETGEPGGSSKLLLDYLDVPVLARVGAPGAAGVHVFGGPYVGFRTRAKLEHVQSANSMNVGSRQDVGSDVERTELGVVAGAGLHLGRHGVLDGRYVWGLTNMNRDTRDVRLKNRVANVMIGVRF